MRETWCYGLLWRTMPYKGVMEHKVSYQCKKHPRYDAERKPRTACEGCWRMYLGVTS